MSDRFASILALGRPPSEPRLVYEERVPGRAPRLVALPADLDPRLEAALARRGIVQLYAHQATMRARARAGAHVGIVTGTASGKTLSYLLPALEALLEDPHARVLYLAPTKALAQDQARTLRDLGLGREVRPALYDGDTPAADRPRIRRDANLLLTNPDMLHVSICPNHERWADVLANVTHVIVDEAHVYRGVFGSHVANVLRRLRRVCAIHQCAPQLLLASATIANADEAMAHLTGVPVEIVTDDAAPRAARTVALWNPTLLDADTGERASPLAEASALIATMVHEGLRVICFARSRRTVELIQRTAREVVGARDPQLRTAVAPYRAGYTAEQRRDLERRLASGDLRAVVATNALELGIDIGLLDCCISIGFPGTVASLMQQWGRAGRTGDGLALLIATADALDQYFVRHPRTLLERPVEAAILDAASPEIRAAHLDCAAYEAPISPRDDVLIGAGAYEDALARTRGGGPLRATARGAVWARPEYPAAAVSLRNASGEVVLVVDQDGAILGAVEVGRAFRTVHPGAIYLHLGESYLVEMLDLDERIASVRPFTGDWYTQTRSMTDTVIQSIELERSALGVELRFGRVDVTEQVTGYERKSLPGHVVLDEIALECPPQTFSTQGFWFTVPLALLPDEADLLGTLHAAEHTLIAVLPLHAMCDRWDLGGLSTNIHPQTLEPTIFVHEAHPGGVGLVRQGFAAFEDLVAHAAQVIGDCPCASGCPSCVQSPKCGNLNEPLAKDGARVLLESMLRLAAP